MPTLLVWSMNLLVGLGLLALGAVMLRRPGRLWIGVRVPRTPEETARTRLSNLMTAPWLLLLGLAEVLSGAVALAAGISALTLAFVGLAMLLLAIGVIAATALFSR